MARDLKAKIRLTADADQANRELKKTKKTFGDLVGAIAGSTAAIAAFTSGLVFAVKAAIEQQLAIAKLDNQLRSLGDTAASVSQALQAQASALQSVSVFGDEAIISAQAVLAQFTQNEQQLKDLTVATLDFASATGTNLAGAASLVGKAFGTSTNALTRYGIEVEGVAGSTERLDQLTKNLAIRMGGSAAAAADTFGGQLQQLTNSLGDTAEVIGAVVTESENLAVGLRLAREAVDEFNATLAETEAPVFKITQLLLNVINPIESVVSALASLSIQSLIDLAFGADEAADSVDGMKESLDKAKKALRAAAEAEDALAAATKKSNDEFLRTEEAVDAAAAALRKLGVVLDEDVNESLLAQERLLIAVDKRYAAGGSRDEYERSIRAINGEVERLNNSINGQVEVLFESTAATDLYNASLGTTVQRLDAAGAAEIRFADETETSSSRRRVARDAELRALGTQVIFGELTTQGGTFFDQDEVVGGFNGRVEFIRPGSTRPTRI